MPKRLNPAMELILVRQDLREAQAAIRYLQDVQKQHEQTARMMMMDACAIATAEIFDLGAGSWKRWAERCDAILREMCINAVEEYNDGEGDPQISATREDIDNALREIMGAEFRPFVERYEWEEATEDGK